MVARKRTGLGQHYLDGYLENTLVSKKGEVEAVGRARVAAVDLSQKRVRVGDEAQVKTHIYPACGIAYAHAQSLVTHKTNQCKVSFQQRNPFLIF